MKLKMPTPTPIVKKKKDHFSNVQIEKPEHTHTIDCKMHRI